MDALGGPLPHALPAMISGSAASPCLCIAALHELCALEVSCAGRCGAPHSTTMRAAQRALFHGDETSPSLRPPGFLDVLQALLQRPSLHPDGVSLQPHRGGRDQAGLCRREGFCRTSTSQLRGSVRCAHRHTPNSTPLPPYRPLPRERQAVFSRSGLSVG